MIKYIIIFLILTFSLHADSVYDMLQKADIHFQEKDYQGSLKLYKKSSAMNPTSIRALVGVGVVSEILGYRFDALNAYNKILNLSPENTAGITGVARILAEDKKFNDALAKLEKPLAKEPLNEELLFTKAYIFLKQEKFNPSIHILEDLRKRNKLNQKIEAVLADAYSGAGYYDKSFEILERLIQSSPENYQLFVTKSSVYLAQYEKSNDETLIDKAIENAQTALSIFPYHPEARVLLMKLLIFRSRMEEAEKYSESLALDFPDRSEFFFFTGYINFKLNNNGKAKKFFSKALAKNDLNEAGRLIAENFALKNLKENDSFRVNLSNYRYKQYNRNQKHLLYGYALFNLQRSAMLNPDNEKIKIALTEFYRKSGNIQSYINLLIQRRNENPDNFTIKNELKVAISELKNTLPYKEGFVKIETDGVKINYHRTPKYIFLFDISAKPLFESLPSSSYVISDSIREFLSNYTEFSVIAGQDYKKYSDNLLSIAERKNYSEAITPSPKKLQLLANSKKPVNYFISGNGNFSNNSVSLKLNVTDLKSAEIADKIFLMNDFRDSIAMMAVSISNKLKNLPRDGFIIKMENDYITVNLGITDGLSNNDIISITRNGTEIARAKVTESSRFISNATPLTRDFFRICKEGDRIVKVSGK